MHVPCDHASPFLRDPSAVTGHRPMVIVADWEAQGCLLGLIDLQLVEEVAHVIRIGLGGRRALGFLGDAVADVVQHRIKLVVDELLMRIGGRPEPQVVDVHERDQVTERRALDRAQLIKAPPWCRAFRAYEPTPRAS